MYETFLNFLYPVRRCFVDRGQPQQFQKTKDTQSGGYDATAPCDSTEGERNATVWIPLASAVSTVLVTLLLHRETRLVDGLHHEAIDHHVLNMPVELLVFICGAVLN